MPASLRWPAAAPMPGGLPAGLHAGAGAAVPGNRRGQSYPLCLGVMAHLQACWAQGESMAVSMLSGLSLAAPQPPCGAQQVRGGLAAPMRVAWRRLSRAAGGRSRCRRRRCRCSCRPSPCALPRLPLPQVDVRLTVQQVGPWNTALGCVAMPDLRCRRQPPPAAPCGCTAGALLAAQRAHQAAD